MTDLSVLDHAVDSPTVTLHVERLAHPWWCVGTEDQVDGVNPDGTINLLHEAVILGGRDDDLLVVLDRVDRVDDRGTLVERGDWTIYTDQVCDDRGALNAEQLDALDKALTAAEAIGTVDRPDREHNPGVYLIPLSELELTGAGTGPYG